MSQFCTQCGTENVNDAKFCKSCGNSLVEQKVPSSSEPSVVQPEPTHEQDISVIAESKKENQKYGKLGGWLIVLAVLIVLAILVGFLRIERFFENQHLDALKLLYQKGMDQKASLLNTIAYISFVSYGLLLTFAISFFRKDILTKNFAIIHFGFNIVAFPIMTYLLVKIDLPTIDITTGVIGGVAQTLVALVLIRYFMVSERVKKTFVNENDENGNYIMATLGMGLGAIILASVLYTNQSDKNTLINEQKAAAVQTTSEAVDASYAPAAAEAAAPADAAAPLEAAPVLSTAEQSDQDYDNGQASKYYDLGRAYYSGLDGMQKDLTKALEFYKKSCDQGYVQGCDSAAAVFHDIDMSKAKAYALKAIVLYKKDCNSGNVDGCREVCNYYNLGMYVKTDQSIVEEYASKGFALYKKACDRGDAEACSATGQDYLEGWGVKQNIVRGENLLRNSCDNGNGYGCRQLGFAYYLGHDLEKDYSKAAQYFKKACDIYGNTYGCDQYEELQKQGY